MAHGNIVELSDSLTATPKVKLLTVRQLACHLNKHAPRPQFYVSPDSLRRTELSVRFSGAHGRRALWAEQRTIEPAALLPASMGSRCLTLLFSLFLSLSVLSPNSAHCTPSESNRATIFTSLLRKHSSWPVSLCSDSTCQSKSNHWC